MTMKAGATMPNLISRLNNLSKVFEFPIDREATSSARVIYGGGVTALYANKVSKAAQAEISANLSSLNTTVNKANSSSKSSTQTTNQTETSNNNMKDLTRPNKPDQTEHGQKTDNILRPFNEAEKGDYKTRGLENEKNRQKELYQSKQNKGLYIDLMT